MISLNELLEELRYTNSPNYHTITKPPNPISAQTYRLAKRVGVQGVYVINTRKNQALESPSQPTVFVAEAQTVEEAREIHRSLWNFSSAPFLIVYLPNHIRVYNSFSFSSDEKDNQDLLLDEPVSRLQDVRTILSAFTAELSILDKFGIPNLWII